jgi:hypothetical protein
LTNYAGPTDINTPGTVIDGKAINSCLRVNAPGVVIRRSKITGVGCSPDVVGSLDGEYDGTPLTIEDSEVTCNNSAGTALGDTHIVARRLNVHGCENGFDLDMDIDIEDSFVHDLWHSTESHSDDIQFGWGHYISSTNPTLVQGTLNVTIKHNTLLAHDFDGSDDTNSSIITDPQGDTNTLIQSNLMAGGTYTLYCERNGAGSNFRVIDNHFSTMYFPKVGYYGPSTDCADEVQSGNVIHETGAALSLD